MDIEQARAYCLSFPHATENVQWGNDLVFKIAGKMFAVTVLEGASKYCLSFKCGEEKFAELIEQDGIDPAYFYDRFANSIDATGFLWHVRRRCAQSLDQRA
jgi:predicted DNA-binding protein (MmcQ/YjbR family)